MKKESGGGFTRWAGHITGMEGNRSVFNILAGKRLGSRLLGRRGHRF